MHICYLQTLGSFEEDMIVCRPEGTGGFVPIQYCNTPQGWTYCEQRVTCAKCKGDLRNHANTAAPAMKGGFHSIFSPRIFWGQGSLWGLLLHEVSGKIALGSLGH